MNRAIRATRLERQPQIDRQLQVRQLDLRRQQVGQLLHGVGRHLDHRGTGRRWRRDGARAQVRASPFGVSASGGWGDSVSSLRRLRRRSPRSVRNASPDFGASNSAAPAPTSRPTPKMLSPPNSRSDGARLARQPQRRKDIVFAEVTQVIEFHRSGLPLSGVLLAEHDEPLRHEGQERRRRPIRIPVPRMRAVSRENRPPPST